LSVLMVVRHSQTSLEGICLLARPYATKTDAHKGQILK